jgi:hypothetical protein
MAYGTKFSLTFSDDYNEFTYRVLIQKDGYTGTVYPLIGTNDPVVLEWEGDDDFYQPIKGSKCRINLMVTDDTNYDQFHLYDEREYKVLLQWLGYNSNTRPAGRGPQSWNTFWTGWLVADTFQEAVLTKPYPISLNAIDGLGTLSDVVLDPTDWTPQFGESDSDYPYQIDLIAHILETINFDLKIRTVHEWAPWAVLGIKQERFCFDSFVEDGKILNGKDALIAVLQNTNSRIFQSDNYWTIIPNSCYEAKDFTIEIRNLALALGTTPTIIRSRKTNYLTSNQSEEIEFAVFNSDNTYDTTQTSDAYCAVPGDIINVGADLMVEYLPPYKNVISNYQIDSYNKRRYQINPNQFFEYGNTGYDVTEGSIATSFPYKYEDSNYSYRSLQYTLFPSVNTEVIKTEIVDNGENGFFSPNAEAEVDIEFVFDSDYDPSGSLFEYIFKYTLQIQHTLSSITYTYTWDGENNEWSPVTGGGPDILEKKIESENAFGVKQNAQQSFRIFNFPTGSTDRTFKCIIYRPYLSDTTDYDALYVTAVQMQIKDLAGNSVHQYKFSQANNSATYDSEKVSIDHIRGATRSFSGKNFGVTYVRPRNQFLTNPIAENSFTIVTQEINNDFRSNLRRYEGTFKSNFYKPLNLSHRIFVDFGLSVLRLPDSCYLDAMTFNLKRNTYKVNMHLPNIDNDVTVTKDIRFIS